MDTRWKHTHRGAGSSFAVMPTAFIDTKKNGLMLVGKKSANGTIFRLNDDGSERSDTGLDGAAFLLKCDTDVIP